MIKLLLQCLKSKAILPRYIAHSHLCWHIRWWWIFSSSIHRIIIWWQQHRSVIGGNVHQHIWVVPAINVSVTVPHAAYQVTLKSQNDAYEKEYNHNQACRVHRHDLFLVGKIAGQLAEVVLNCAGIDKYTDGNQRVESKVKDLVTEERDDPSRMLLIRAIRSHCTNQNH